MKIWQNITNRILVSVTNLKASNIWNSAHTSLSLSLALCALLSNGIDNQTMNHEYHENNVLHGNKIRKVKHETVEQK